MTDIAFRSERLGYVRDVDDSPVSADGATIPVRLEAPG